MDRPERFKAAALLCLGVLCGCGSDALPTEPEEQLPWTPEGPNVLNLGFEQVLADGTPKRWFTGGDGYDVRTVTSPAFEGGRSLRMTHQSGDGFGVATLAFPVDDARSSRLKLTGYIKTEVGSGWAGLWMRVDGPDGETLAFDNMSDRGIGGSRDWSRAQIELPVAEDAAAIYFGALLPGRGSAWFDALWLEVDGVPYQPAVVLGPTQADLDWLVKSYHEFDTEQPGGGLDDLAFLADLVGPARIASLGEGTHGTSEFFRMKHRITEFLATRMGFTVFAIEANMTESRAINRYVLNGEGNPRDALDGIYFWTWNTREVLDMIEWMRSYNASGTGQMQFLGFDAQFPNVAADSVEAFLAEVEPAYVATARAHYDIVRQVYDDRVRSFGDPSVVVDEDAWAEAAAAVLAHLQDNRDAYLLAKTASEVDWAIQDARIVLQSADPRSRDRSMAENVDWILDHSQPGTRIVLWAHNGHVRRRPGWMGSYLDAGHGARMQVFGFAFHEGEYTAVGPSGLGTYTTSASEAGSAEWAFHRTGSARFILDLRLASASDPASAWLTRAVDFRNIGARARSYAFSRTVLPEDYDVVVFFDRSTPSQLLDPPAGSASVISPGPR